jgi:uncharacterized protein (DUF1778 family)
MKKPKQTKSKRITVTLRLLPEIRAVLEQAAAATDTTRGRYVEKALKVQFKKDGMEI